jgi:hypothetical protein
MVQLPATTTMMVEALNTKLILSSSHSPPGYQRQYHLAQRQSLNALLDIAYQAFRHR